MAMRILAIALAAAGLACWLWPGAVVSFLFPGLTVGARESAIIGALLFISAAILWFVRPSNDEGP
jgi:hypothetical protein